jgi:hypothetical protein
MPRRSKAALCFSFSIIGEEWLLPVSIACTCEVSLDAMVGLGLVEALLKSGTATTIPNEVARPSVDSR